MIYLDGAFVHPREAKVAALDRGLLFGRGVFETFRAREGRVFRLDRHAERLRAGCALLGIDPPLTAEQVERAVLELTRRCGLSDARVRLTVTAGPEGGPASTLMTARAADDYTPELHERGASVVVATVRRNETSPLSRVKSLQCLDSLLAREDARRRGADEALLLNTSGRLAEGAFTNVFLVRGGQLTTPPISEGALPGIARGAVLELALRSGLAVREAPVALEDALAADEAFLTNAVAGILPLTVIDGRPVGAGRPGSLTLRLRAALERAATPAAARR